MLLALYTLVVVLFLFGFTIFVHELGHFLVARWCGMRIEVFSIGFGPAIWKTRRNGILYKIGAFPLGGYVALPQMDSAGGTTRDEVTGAEIPLPPVAPIKRIPVALAGAIGNMILAVILAYIIYWHGMPAAPHELSATIGFVAPDSAAHEQGLRAGQTIVRANGEAVRNWKDILVISSLSTQVVLAAASDTERVTAQIPTEKVPLGGRLIPGVYWIEHCDVAQVMRGSTAEAAGVLPGDRIIEFDGIPLYSRPHLSHLVQDRAGVTTTLVVLRDGERVSLQVTPARHEEEDRVLIGVGWNFMSLDLNEIVHPRPGELIREFSSMIFKVVVALATPKTSSMAAQSLGGPPLIFKILWDIVPQSFIMALWFTCLLNVNLAILNLLPIPVLDGGHILFALWELITRRRVNPRFMAVIISFFAVLLIGAILYMSGRDLYRMLSRPNFAAPADPPAAVEDESALPEPEESPAEP